MSAYSDYTHGAIDYETYRQAAEDEARRDKYLEEQEWYGEEEVEDEE